MTKSRTHRFVLTITADKPCSRAFALREARDCIHGDFYTTASDDAGDPEPETFRVRSIRNLPKWRVLR